MLINARLPMLPSRRTLVDVVRAENSIRAVQAAGRYSWRDAAETILSTYDETIDPFGIEGHGHGLRRCRRGK
jgi:hypothetical protein